MTNSSSLKPTFAVGQKVQFQHPDDFNCEWLDGFIQEFIHIGGQFWGYKISYSLSKKDPDNKGKYMKIQKTCNHAREQWIRKWVAKSSK